MTIDEFWAKYEETLARCMEDKPHEYMMRDAKVVTARIRARFEATGNSLRGINIDGSAFKSLARQLGIKNTYKAWKEFIDQLATT